MPSIVTETATGTGLDIDFVAGRSDLGFGHEVYLRVPCVCGGSCSDEHVLALDRGALMEAMRVQLGLVHPLLLEAQATDWDAGLSVLVDEG